MTQLLICDVTALSIATLYYLWRDAYVVRLARQRQLCDRVAFMLWSAANRAA